MVKESKTEMKIIHLRIFASLLVKIKIWVRVKGRVNFGVRIWVGFESELIKKLDKNFR